MKESLDNYRALSIILNYSKFKRRKNNERRDRLYLSELRS